MVVIPSKKLSTEERSVISRIALLWMAIWLPLTFGSVYGFKRFTGVVDDLHMYPGLIGAVLLVLSCWLARRAFVYFWPVLSRVADEKAALRLATKAQPSDQGAA
jgi:hypothetical protein